MIEQFLKWYFNSPATAYGWAPLILVTFVGSMYFMFPIRS